MKNADKSAFPPLPSYTDEERGLSKREYFAGTALQGIISEGSFETNNEGIKAICGSSIKIADELLKQLGE